tara:strand:+ start:3407 stop:4318 length:912 start_codon:yes stop_codon:yes gene_type:complete
MAVTFANDDIQVIAAEACVQENLPVDDLRVHALELSPQTASGTPAIYGDTTKVPIYAASGAATTFDKSTNNYETASASQSVTYKSVVIDQRKKRTIEVDELKILRTDVAPLVRLELENVARTMVDDVNGLILAANFATSVNIGLASAWDSDGVIDLRNDEEQIRKYPTSMRKLALNVDYSVALQKDPAIKNHNTLRPVDLPNNQLLTSFAKFGGGLWEQEQLPTGENLVGMATNGCGIAIAMPSTYQQNDPDTYEQTTIMWNGFPFLMRKHKKKGSGDIYITIEAQYGFAVADELGIVRLTSA